MPIEWTAGTTETVSWDASSSPSSPTYEAQFSAAGDFAGDEFTCFKGQVGASYNWAIPMSAGSPPSSNARIRLRARTSDGNVSPWSVSAPFTMLSGTTAVGNILNAIWDLRAIAGQNLEALWSARALVAGLLSSPWAARSLTTSELEAVWRVLGSGAGADLGLVWDTRAPVGDDLALVWAARMLAAAGIALEWDVLREVLADIGLDSTAGSRGLTSDAIRGLISTR